MGVHGMKAETCSVFGNSAGNYAKWFGTRGVMDAKNLSPREHWMATGEGSGEPDRIRVELAKELIADVRRFDEQLGFVVTL